MKILATIILISLVLSKELISGDNNHQPEQAKQKNLYQLYQDLKLMDESGFFDIEFTPRRTRALIYSSLVPGSGQTYLGEELKGMALSIAFYGSALYAIIAHNNALGREDRIKVLTQEYKSKGNYNEAEKVWQSILSEKSLRDDDYKRRSIFSWLAAGIWVYNVFDVLFLTGDEGEKEFSMNNSTIYVSFTNLNYFNGIALKLNLP